MLKFRSHLREGRVRGRAKCQRWLPSHPARQHDDQLDVAEEHLLGRLLDRCFAFSGPDIPGDDVLAPIPKLCLLLISCRRTSPESMGLAGSRRSDVLPPTAVLANARSPIGHPSGYCSPENAPKSGERFSTKALAPSLASSVQTTSSSPEAASALIPAWISVSTLNDCFRNLMAVALSAATSLAQVRASSMSRSPGTTKVTRPHCCAVAASYSRHQNQVSRARVSPTSRAR